MTNHFKLSTARRNGHAFTLKQRGRRGGFTLAEMLVSIAVLTLLVLMVTQLINSAAIVVRPANKHTDTDSQARGIFDRMAVDFGRMLKRTDVDYYFKANQNKYPGKSGLHSKGGGAQGQTDLNDYIAFYSQVGGYDPFQGSSSPISLVSYRVNGVSTSASYNRLERLGKALIWNGYSFSGNPNNPRYPIPIVFLPLTIAATWPAITNNQTDPDSQYETVGPQVFRFEYYYLLKNGNLTDTPWDAAARPTQTSLTSPASIGLTDVEAIAVTIAVIDPQSRSLLTNGDPTEQNLLNLQLAMNDFKTQKGQGPMKNGVLEVQWNQVITNPVTYPVTATMPRAVLSAIRIYNRYFDLKTL